MYKSLAILLFKCWSYNVPFMKYEQTVILKALGTVLLKDLRKT